MMLCRTGPATARARARAELTAEIKATARRHLAEVGAPALSLRAVARELGMASSAVYRYFESRDALLTALIVDAFDAVGETAEAGPRGRAEGRGRSLAGHRDRHPPLGAGQPPRLRPRLRQSGARLPAPRDTVTPAARVSLVMLGIVAQGVASGEIDARRPRRFPRPCTPTSPASATSLRPASPTRCSQRALLVWTGLFGTISYELFGHLHRVIEDYDAFFDHQVGRAGAYLLGA